MAVLTTRRRRDPEGRMALREHLLELRKRVVRSAATIVVCAVGGWFVHERVLRAIVEPVLKIKREHPQAQISINFVELAGAFNLAIQLSILVGVVLASPVWLYQFWAFITPGLTRRERRSSLGFVGAALPLFLCGAGLAWWALPQALA